VVPPLRDDLGRLTDSDTSYGSRDIDWLLIHESVTAWRR
jgi:hypothetical protein